MLKSRFITFTVSFVLLALLSACSQELNDNATVKNTAAMTADQSTVNTTATSADPNATIMHQPVDFSTPEKVSQTLKNIREQAGARTARKLDAAMGYIMTYDLGVARDEAKMYKKLNGKTPSQIIAMIKR